MNVVAGSVFAALIVASVVHADEAAVRKQFQALYPKAVVESVQKTPLPGLYEVFSNGRIFYTDGEVTHIIQGSLIDTGTHRNLTEERLQKLTALPFSQLPIEFAIKFVKGEGKRQIAVFSDPDCPYCRQLEQAFSRLDNVTIYVFLYPIEELHRGATEKSRRIWCAPDRAKAWHQVMLQRIIVDTPATCDNPVDKLVQFGRRYRISGTPTMILPDDRRMPGAESIERLETILDEAYRKTSRQDVETPSRQVSQ